MGLIERDTLINHLSPPFERSMTEQLIDEYISLERRFIQRDWEPAQLDGGQFCEVLARLIYHQDSGVLNLSKSLEDCLRYVENDTTPHAIIPRSNALHIGRVLKTVYKFRSQRGAVHISPNYTPNHMDAKMVIENVRWAMSETLRIFWQGDRDKVAKAIRELLQFDVPCVGIFAGEILVQRTDLIAEEEVLVLLHYAGEQGFTRNELGRYSRFSPSSVTSTLQKLASSSSRQIIFVNCTYRLTDIGSKRVREELADKLRI